MNRLEFAALVAGAAFATAPAFAEEPQTIATYKDWSVFTRHVGDDVICYAATEAQDKSPKSVNHGDIFFLVATWKSGAARNQPSFMAGYNLKDSPAPTIRIDSEKWDMYVSDNEAFIEGAKDEQSLISAMRRGSEMRISAISNRGTATSYQMSLLGFSNALDRVADACK